MEFEILGGGDIDRAVMPSAIKRAISFLETLPDGKLVTTDRLATEIGIQAASMKHHTMNPHINPYKIYSTAGGKQNYYGNKNTVKEFKKRNG